MGVTDLTCTRIGQKFKYSQIISPYKVKLMELRELSCHNPTIQMLDSSVLEGWPQHKRDVPLPLKSFWNVRNDFLCSRWNPSPGQQACHSIGMEIRYTPEIAYKSLRHCKNQSLWTYNGILACYD